MPIDDSESGTCNKLKNLELRGRSRIQEFLAHTEPGVLSAFRDELARNGIAIDLYEYPFEIDSPSTITQIYHFDNRIYHLQTQELLERLSAGRDDLGEVNTHEQQKSVDKYLNWAKRLEHFCAKVDERESRLVSEADCKTAAFSSGCAGSGNS